LEIYIDSNAEFPGVSERLPDVTDMLFRCAAQLSLNVFERTFAKKVHNLASCAVNPVQRLVVVDKAENFNSFEEPIVLSPSKNFTGPLKFPLRNPRRCDLDAIDANFLEQHFSDVELFGSCIGNPGGLFAIPQGRVHDLYKHTIETARVRESGPS